MKITDLRCSNPPVGLLLHELVLHLLDGLLHGLWVEPPDLILVQVAYLPKHLSRDLEQTQHTPMNITTVHLSHLTQLNQQLFLESEHP